MHDVRISEVQEGYSVEGSGGRSGDGVYILTVAFTLALVHVSMRDTTSMVATWSGHTGVRAVVHVHAGQGLRQDMQGLVVDYHLEKS